MSNESRDTHFLDAVAALNGTGAAVSGGRKNGEGNERGNSNDAREHGEDFELVGSVG